MITAFLLIAGLAGQGDAREDARLRECLEALEQRNSTLVEDCLRELRAAPEAALNLALPTWPELGSILPNCRETLLENHNHFIPMQDPDLVARYIEELCEAGA